MNTTIWLENQWDKMLKKALEMDDWEKYGLEVREIPQFLPDKPSKWSPAMISSLLRGLRP